jgi:hypothetical protein
MSLSIPALSRASLFAREGGEPSTPECRTLPVLS